jgi:2-methylcitrate dehydratase
MRIRKIRKLRSRVNPMLSRATFSLPRLSRRRFIATYPVNLAPVSFKFTTSAQRSSLPHSTFVLSTRAMSSHHAGESTLRPEPDKVLQDIADYVHDYKITSELAFETARLCLIDTIGCGLEGLRFPECTKLLGPVVEGTVVPNG